MATVYSGKRCQSPPAVIISGAGKLLGFMVSHAQATVQTLTFYDNVTASGTVLLQLYIDPGQCPYYIQFPRQLPLEFSPGLSAAYTNCDLSIWAVDYE